MGESIFTKIDEALKSIWGLQENCGWGTAKYTSPTVVIS